MRHLMSLAAVAALSISSLARAEEARATRESALTRRLLLPSLVGVGVGAKARAQPLDGACPLSTGLFSYLNSNGGDGSHYVGVAERVEELAASRERRGVRVLVNLGVVEAASVP